ncbi:DUF421 domain-containing protein [Paenibacillus aurantius]|uniref:DUF421 domain-containing protein n=1 Tax=Paenibacillus aurantius TaxID=2918900 RepID=A0AA96LF01_9BACL|nr:DUF421 domain-containing protein [Paenibacillus aurantius]WNQ12090.1 DUF421 domain-containing protein [Paenibacillus aurantius]
MDYGLIAVKLVTGFAGLWLITRILGKKEISQLTPFDFVSSLMLSELVGNTVYDKDANYRKLLFALALWMVLSYLFEVLTQKFRGLRRPLDGSPSLVIHNGEVNLKEMKKNKLDFDQLRMMLRQKDIFAIEEVAFAMLETNGQLSVLKKPDFEAVTVQDLKLEPEEKAHLPRGLVEFGEIQLEELRKIGRDEGWLRQKLRECGFGDVRQVAYAEWRPGQGLHVLRK